MHVDVDFELDASGLNCPLPLLKAKKALAALNSGQLLRIIATDPGSQRDFEAFADTFVLPYALVTGASAYPRIIDFEAFAHQAQHELLESREEVGKFVYILKKG